MSKAGSEKTSQAGEYQPDGAVSRANLDSLDFNAQVVHVLELLTAISADIRERDHLKRDKTSHPLAQIKLTTRIEARLQQARADLDTLITIYDRITSSRRYRKRYTEEEIRKFEDTIRNLEDQYSTYDCNRYKGAASSSRRRINLDLSAPADGDKVTEEDQTLANESIQRWRQRDENFDRQLQEIGEAVDRIGEVAVTIGECAAEQAKNAIETMSKVQDTTTDISAVSLQIKRLIRRQRHIECTCRIGLILTFLTLLAIFIFCLFKFLKQ